MADYLYLHIPFCVRKCIYCDFLSIPFDESVADIYVEALCSELVLKKELAGHLESVYIGGGTPSLLSGHSLLQLFAALRNSFRLSPSVEMSVEVNPGTLDWEKLDLILSLGVNRLSVGVQSFNDEELSLLGRIHSAEDIFRSLDLIRKSGMTNYSLDLMYGIPGQSAESWSTTVKMALEASPSHISAYELTPEKDTLLQGLLKSQALKLPDETVTISMYHSLIGRLAKAGYTQYEVSNFSLPSLRCMHNLNYWNRGEYIGAGAGAHSFMNNIRSRNTCDIQEYTAMIRKGAIPEVESLLLTPADIIKEFLMLGLRKSEGIDLSEAEAFVPDITGKCHSLIEYGYLDLKDGHLRLTRNGIVISNTIIVELFRLLKID